MHAKLKISSPGLHRWLPKVVVLLALALSSSSCGLLKSTLELPEKGIRSMLLLDQESGAPDPVELQSSCSAFRTILSKRLIIAVGKLQRENDQVTTKKKHADAPHRHHQRYIGHRYRVQHLCQSPRYDHLRQLEPDEYRGLLDAQVLRRIG